MIWSGSSDPKAYCQDPVFCTADDVSVELIFATAAGVE